MSIIKKQLMVSDFANIAINKRFVLIGENKGMKVAHMNMLRKHGRDKEVVVKVMKNSLLKRSLVTLSDVDEHLVGQNIIALSNDELTATKLFQEFITLTKLIDFKIAYVDQKKLDISSLKELAKIESKDELYRRLVYALDYATKQ